MAGISNKARRSVLFGASAIAAFFAKTSSGATMPGLMPAGKHQYFYPGSTQPLAGGKLYTYAAGTSTLKATYQDAAGTIANTNPITLDSTGSALIVWSGSYKVVLQDAAGNTVYTFDNYNTDLAASLQMNLAAPSGSSLVGFMQAGAGAIARTVQDMFRERVSVTHFGAKGDGKADDTAAIVAAYNHLVSKGGGILDFPNPANNVYTMSGNDTLRIRASNIHIRGNGAAIKLLGKFVGTYGYFTSCAAQNGLIKIFAATDSVNDYVENISIEGLRFLDTPTTDGSHCYHLTIMQARNVRVSGCDFMRASIGGIRVTGSRYQGATAAGRGSDYSYKLLYQTTGVMIDDCFFDGEGVQTPSLEGNIRVGVQIEAGAYKTSVNNCRFKDCVKAYVREIGGIGTTISNPQVWTTSGTVNGNDITASSWSWPAGQIGTAGRTDGSVMGTANGCKVSNPNIHVHHHVGVDVQRSVETTVTGGQIYNKNSAPNFVAINGQNSAPLNSTVGRIKSRRHTYLGVHTNGAVNFLKPAGEDSSYQDVSDITVMGCAGRQFDVSGVVSGLNWTANNFQTFNSSVDSYARLIRIPSSDPQTLTNGDYHPGSLIVNSYAAGMGNLSLVQTGGTVASNFPAGVTGTSTGGHSFTTNNAAAFHAGMYVTANGVKTQISSVVPNTADAGGTVHTYDVIKTGTAFAVTVTAPVLDLPNAAAGTTAQRPSLQAWQAGFVYFDKTIGKPVFWSGTKWTDAAGLAV